MLKDIGEVIPAIGITVDGLAGDEGICRLVELGRGSVGADGPGIGIDMGMSSSTVAVFIGTMAD